MESPKENVHQKDASEEIRKGFEKWKRGNPGGNVSEYLAEQRRERRIGLVDGVSGTIEPGITEDWDIGEDGNWVDESKEESPEGNRGGTER
jgi:hypothetical protein